MTNKIENKITSIKDRVIKIAEIKGISKEKFFTELGTTSANFRGKAKETPLNSNTIINIIACYPEINLRWLLTGEGEILVNAQETGTNQSGDDKDKEIEELKAEIQFLRGQNDVLREVLNLQSVNKQTGT